MDLVVYADTPALQLSGTDTVAILEDETSDRVKLEE